MKSYLLTYNQNNFDWHDYENALNKTQKGEKYILSWSCSNTHVQLGDRIFVMQVGTDRGIFASGKCIKDSYKKEHYDSSLASQGRETTYIDVEFDYILDLTNQINKMLILDVLKQKFPKQVWTPQSSGIEINDLYYPQLETMWANSIGIKNDLFYYLMVQEDINKNTYDGSYKLIEEVVKSYSAFKKSDSYSVNFSDLDLIYSTVIIFNKPDRISDLIDKCSLPVNEKIRLKNILSDVWNNARNHNYQNISKGTESVGMFGTGFYSFNKVSSSTNLPNKIIDTLVGISNLQTDDEMYSIVERELPGKIKGIGIASLSEMLHCLKPESFPIINGNQGFPNIFISLGLNLSKNITINDYISDCKVIKDFRDKNYTFKNYRVFDIVSRKIEKINTNYKQMFDFLSKYSGELYADENKYDYLVDNNILTSDEVNKIKEIDHEGKASLNSLKSLADYLCNIYYNETNDNLEKKGNNRFSSQDNTLPTHSKVRDYLWYQLVNPKFKKIPFALSIFVEKDNGTQRIKICIEKLQALAKKINNKKGANYNETLANYFSNSDDIFNNLKTQNLISRTIYRDDNLNDDDYTKLIKTYFEELIPQYNKIIGLDNNNNVATDHTEEVADSNVELGLNTILYGPPGTGKTYNTKRLAVSICENISLDEAYEMDYNDEILPLYEKYVEENRIKFITFHQSYGYEEFIEGIKPIIDDNEVYYDVVPGVFKDFCDLARNNSFNKNKFNIDNNTKIWKMSLYGGNTNILQECFDENYVRIGFDYNSNSTSIDIFKNKMAVGDIILSLKGVNEINGIAIIEGDVETLDSKAEFKVARKVKWLFKNKVVNILAANGGNRLAIRTCSALPHIDRNALLKLIVENSEVTLEEDNGKKPYVFIIDEINRGNISKIFGELITLIEDSKREGNDEAMSVVLPYSKMPFSIPNNVYILGTMNTADRSISLIDTALRRRFNFIEMMPDTIDLDYEIEGLNIKNMLDTINKRIEILYDREHTIGHAFFSKPKLTADSTVYDLAVIFKNKIIPLLQEYFYEDYGKIRLVLGDNDKTLEKYQFIREFDNSKEKAFKGNFDRDLVENFRYEINEDAFNEIESYKQII